jgi:dolichyl-phosphate beta-glucosyltransferase
VVVPAYNEERRLLTSLPKISGYLRAHFVRHEILVVDDGSTDATAAVVTAFAQDAPAVRLLQLPVNSGKGAAVRAGMLAAAGDLVWLSDADLSTPIEELDNVLRHLRAGVDVVIGSRDLPESQIQRHQNPLRETMGKLFNLIVRLLSGLPYHDTQCGFKCYRRAAARAIFHRARINGFAFDVETLVLARRLGCRTVEMPVRWVNCPQSKVRILRHPAEMVLELLTIRLNEARGRYQ